MQALEYKMHKDFAFDYSAPNILGAPAFHIHEGYEMIYLISGSLELFIKDQVYSVAPSNITIIPKGAIHKTRNSASTYERIIWNFTDNAIDADIMPEIGKLFSHRVYAPTDTKFINTLIKNFKAEKGKNDIFSQKLSIYYLNILLIHLARNMDSYAVTDNKITNPTVERLIKYANQNYGSPVTLKDISKKFKLTPNYLSTLFYENTGIHFKEYLTNIRIRHAKDMLDNTDKSIKTVAYDCGFNDSNYFSTAFKEIVGVPPIAYRKNNS